MKNTTTHKRKPKEVGQYSIDDKYIDTFSSLNAAEKATGVPNGSISRVCNGKSGHAGGFKWKFVAQVKPVKPPANPIEILYDKIKAVVEHNCILKQGYSDVITLWILGTYFISEISFFPRLVITAPSKGCGKSQVLKVIHALTTNSAISINPTSPVIFRLDKTAEPIRLIDEADWWLKRNNDAIDILNAGVEPVGIVERMDANNKTVEKHNVFMPIALAGIGLTSLMEDSTLSRSIILNIQKESGAPSIEIHSFIAQHKSLVSEITKASVAHKHLFTKIEPPNHPEPRFADVWRALFGIAGMIGKPKIDIVSEQYTKFGQLVEQTDEGILLLEAVKRVLKSSTANQLISKVGNVEYVGSSLLHERVTKDAEFIEHGLQLTLTKFSTMIKDFDVGNKRITHPKLQNRIKGFNLRDLNNSIKKYTVQ